MNTWNPLLDQLGLVLQTDVLRIVTDSREVIPGDLFIALNAGCRYIDEALEKGAVQVVSQVSHPDHRVLLVADAVVWLGRLAALHRESLKGIVIGITGSVGKTSLSQCLGQALSRQGTTIFPKGSYNNEIGVPLTLLRATPETEYVVVEMGVAKPGDMDYLVEIVKPTMVVITEIGPSHLQALKNTAGVWQEKRKIMRYADIAILNADSIRMPSDENCRFYWFGHQAETTVVKNKVICQGKTYVYDPSILKHRLYTYAQAHIVFSILGLTADFSNIVWPKSRLEISDHVSGARIIDDCYNANFLSYTVALKYIVKQKNYRVVLGEMADLGEMALYYHRLLGRLMNYLHIDKAIMVGPLHKETMCVFLGEVTYYPTTQALKNSVRFEPGTCVLIKGSRSLGLEAVL